MSNRKQSDGVPRELESAYSEFLSAESESQQSPLIQNIAKKYASQLVRSPFRLGLFYVGLSLVGYFVSLVICAQNAVGIFNFSFDLANKLCMIPMPWCWMVCGALFSGVPFLISLATLNRFQQRYLLFKMWWLVAAIPVAAAALMLAVPSAFVSELAMPASMRLEDLSSVLPWTLSAIATPYLLEACLYFFIRQKQWSAHQTVV